MAYIEKTLADSYRKEIDQEENVWRSLPFFAATLALQLAALFQIIDKLPSPSSWAGVGSEFFLAAAAGSTLISLCFLAASIYPQKFDYLAREPLLLDYARNFLDYEQSAENHERQEPLSALIEIKTEISRQYARATDNNRQINKRRERWRSVAGLAALASVLMTVFLVATTYDHYLSIRLGTENTHAATETAKQPSATGNAGEQRGSAPGSVTAPDASHH